MAEKPSALLRVREVDPPELGSGDAGYPVMPRQALVDVRVVRPDQLQHTPVVADRAGDEQLRLLPERLHQVLVEVRIPAVLDHHFVEATELEPLGREIGRERLDRTRVGEHSPDFPLQGHRLGELSPLGQVEKALVGDAAPEEEREA